MKCYSYTSSSARCLPSLLLIASLAFSLNLPAAPVTLATSPLITATTSSVSPNLMFILDDSGSMGWSYMPDNADDFDGNYGFASNQCNGVYYDPSVTYNPPVESTGASYPNSSFTNAWVNGFNTSAGTKNLETSFQPTSSYTAGKAFYYAYTGTQTTAEKKDYYKTTGIFYRECNSVIGSTTLVDGVNPVNTLFTKHRLSTAETTTITIAAPGSPTATAVSSIKVNGVELLLSGTTLSTTSTTTLAASVAAGINAVDYTATASGSVVTITGPTSAADYMPVITKSGNLTLTTDVFPDTTAAKLTNFANWYSYYRTRMLMMKTSTGLAFKPIDNKFRVGFMTINNNVSPDAVDIATFDAAQKSALYTKLYAATPNNMTPLREALSKAGLFYAHKLSGNLLNDLTVNDPIQYSCQQNFTILSTDGFWNGNDGFKLDGATAVGNQDGLAPRPMYDGALSNKTTSQVFQTQTQLTKSTSQIQKRTLQIQSQTSSLQSITHTLQQATIQQQEQRKELQFATGALQTATSSNSGSSWSAWSNVATCTWDNNGSSRRKCQYAALSGGTNAASTCFTKNQSANTSNGTVWTGDRVSCQYNTLAAVNVATCTPVSQSGSSPYTVLTAITCPTTTTTATVSSCTAAPVNGSGVSISCSYIDGAAVNVSSCTSVAKSTGSPYAGPATTCSYTAFTAWGNASSCIAAAQSTGSPYTVGTATNCQTTDTGWVNSASCTPGVTGGQTVTCQTLTTGPTAVASCTSVAASSGNSWTATSCSTNTIMPSTLVPSCTPVSPSASNSYVTTICNPVSTTVSGVSSCTPQTASASNGWTTVTCSSGSGGTSDTLADTAMYYYQTDLRTTALGNCIGQLTTNVCDNNVFVSGLDNNVMQHMTTFTLGLGARGRMVFSSSYNADTSGDFYSVKNGLTANLASTPPVCSWQATGSICNWPVPASSAIENIDDLWHAAINGRGTYFSATDPNSLATGLASALSSISARLGSAAAAATSTLNPVPGNNLAYLASYTTVKWIGNLEARAINTITGDFSSTATWCVNNTIGGICSAPGVVVTDTSGSSINYHCVTPNSSLTLCPSPGVFDSAINQCSVPMPLACSGTLSAMVTASTDTRTIKTPNNTGTALVDFTYANLDSANFNATHISTLSQWASLTAAQKANAEGANLVNFLRGQYAFEDRGSNVADNRLYRYREGVLGDVLESQPFFVGPPVFNYTDAGYSAFKASKANRLGTVYVGANDGMLHAFAGKDNATTTPAEIGGKERWAFVPSMVVPNMWILADKNYDIKHANFINGSVNVADFYCTSNCGGTGGAPQWRSILVGGLSGGGRGYYALDVTDPAAPSLLWEFTPADDADVGYGFGQAVITKMLDNTWVVLVTSGYNNINPGDGKGYLYALNATTGAIINKISTGVGDTTTPSGLSKIASWNNVDTSNQAGYTYGGDLLGNLWRFDINTGAVLKFATLFSDAAGTTPQPITTTPVLGKITGKRVVFIGTGKYLETSDLTNTQKQTQYAIKDDDATTTLVNPRNTLVQQTLTPLAADNTKRGGSSNAVDFNTGSGWYVDFPDSGERANIDSRLESGTLVAPTIVPSNTVCSPGGYGWSNYFDFKTGGLVHISERLNSPIVGINMFLIGGQWITSYVTADRGVTAPCTDCITSFAPTGFSKRRTIWRELNP